MIYPQVTNYGRYLTADGKKAVCYGMGDGLDAVKQAASAEYNLVVSPSALETAKYLQKRSEHRMLSAILW